jgi:threonine dehydratase
LRGKTLAAVACGANLNFDRLRFIAERAEVGEHREGLFAVTIPEGPGSLRKFCALVGNRNVTEFNYRIADAKRAQIFVGVQIAGQAESRRIAAHFSRHGFKALDLTTDDMAKSHIRHMVGGRSTLAQNELVFHFEFPERSGALMKFLNSMSHTWNISLFHYRNLGADYGRILIGLQVPPKEMKAFRGFLKTLGYPYTEETGSAAYRLFLR